MMRPTAMALVLTGLLAGCSTPTVTGQVVDVAGKPVAGVMVTNTAGALCVTESGDDGKFALSCGGDGLVLAVVKDGWFSNEVKAMGAFDEELGQIRLVKKAPQHGLWRWENGDWVAFKKPGRVKRVVPKARDARKHFLVRDGYEPNEIPAGKTILLDDSAEEWRLWKVGERDLVHHEVAPEPNRYETAYGEQPKMSFEDVEGGRDLITAEIEPGDYFLADWTNGRFNLNKKDKLYTGRWVTAK